MGVFSDRHSQFPFNLFVVIWLLIQQHVKQTNRKLKSNMFGQFYFFGVSVSGNIRSGLHANIHTAYKTATREEKAHINNLVEPGNFDPIINE